MTSRRVMIIDDQEEVLCALQTFLELHGYRVETFSNPMAALQRLNKVDILVVLLDISMPVLDGITLLRRLKLMRPTMHVVMMTGASNADKVKACLEAGAADYLLKPFVDLRQILRILDLSCERVERWEAVGAGTIEAMLAAPDREEP